MIRMVLAGPLLLLAACGPLAGGNQSERAAGAASFPRADRPVARPGQ